MGRQKFLSFATLLFLLNSGSYAEEEDVSNISLLQNGLEISLTTTFEAIDFVEIFDENRKSYILLGAENIRIEKSGSMSFIFIDLKEFRLFTNKRYSLMIASTNEIIEIYVFIGNPIYYVDNYYDFPISSATNIKIVVLNQIRRKRMFYNFLDAEITL